MNLKILLMDEPFGALDPHTRQKMQKHLMDLWQNIDITIIFLLRMIWMKPSYWLTVLSR